MGKKKDGPQIICRMTQSAWRPHTQVPTYYVASKGRKGYFATLNDAINFAEPFSRIEVTSGKYFENVIVNKPLEIGTNANEDVMAEIYSRGVTFTFQTPEAHVEGLKIRTADSKSVGIVVEMGSPRIIRCDVDSIEVNGSATPSIEDNKIHHSKLHGLYVLDNAGGLFRANTIEYHPGFGIVVESDGGPKFTHNKVSFGEMGQVLVKGNVAAGSAVNPVFMFNSMRDEVPDKNDGKLQYSGASALAKLKDLPLKKTGDPVHLLPHVIPRGRLADLDADDNDRTDEALLVDTRAALVVRMGAEPTVVQNTVSGGCANGILIHQGGLGEYAQNKVVNNRGFGICVEDDGTKPLIRDNTINENGAGGLRARNNAAATIRRNTFVENKGPQVVVLKGCEKLLVIKNDIFSGARVGVHCRDRGAGRFQENLFRDCYIAVRVDSQANPHFSQNLMQACHIGAACVRYGRGMFDENEFANNRQTCVAVTTGANPTFFRCRMVASEHAILVQHRGRGRFDGNQVKDNNACQVLVRYWSDPVFVNNHITDGREEGLRISDSARGTYQHNHIAENGIANVEVRSGADPIFESNLVLSAAGTGIMICDGGYGTYLENVVDRNRTDGMCVESGGYPTIRANYINRNQGAGLHVAEGGDGVFEKNEISANRQANVLVTGSASVTTQPVNTSRFPTVGRKGESPRAAAVSSPTASSAFSAGQSQEAMPVLRRNWITHAQTAGVVASSRGRCAVLENVIAYSGQAAVKVTAGSLLFVTANVFEGGEGVSVADEGQCFLLSNRFQGVSGSAVTLLTGARPVMAWNTLVGCNVGFACDGGAGTVFENVIVDCKTGISAKHYNRTIVHSNVITGCAVGCAIEARAKSVIRGNCFQDNGTAVTCDGEGISAVFEANLVLSQRDAGVVVHSGSPTLTSNLYLDNPTNILVGGYTAHNGMPRISDSLIYGGIGVAGASRGRARLDNCLIDRCRMGVTSASYSAPAFFGCCITRCDIGTMFWKDGAGDYDGCRIACNTRNVVVTMRSNPQFLRCVISDGRFFNVTFSGASAGSMVECVITRSKVGGGVHIEREATPKIERCVVADHTGSVNDGAKKRVYRAGAMVSFDKAKIVQRRKSVAAPKRQPSVVRSPTEASGGNSPEQPATLGRSAAKGKPGGSSPTSSTPATKTPKQPAIRRTASKSSLSRRGSMVGGRRSGGVSRRGSASTGGEGPPLALESTLLNELAEDLPDEAEAVADIDAAMSSDSDSDDDAPVRDAFGLLLSDEAKAEQREERRKRRAEQRAQLDPKDKGDYRGHGIVAENLGCGTVVDCRIHGNQVAVSLHTGATTMIEGCTIERNQTYGLLFESGAKGGATRCIVAQNKLNQIVVTGRDTSPTLEGLHVRDSVANGVQVDLDASPKVLSCVIHDVLGSAVHCVEGGSPRVEDTLMFNCQEGITVRNDGGGEFLQNRICRMKTCGIVIEGAHACPKVMQCEVAECTRHGIAVSRNAAPYIMDCMLHHNASWGVEVSEGAKPTISGTFAFKNGDGGMSFTEAASGCLEGSTLFGNRGPGVSVRMQASPTLEGNVFFGGETDAMYVVNSSPAIVRNRVRYHTACGLHVEGAGSAPTVRMNNFDACDHSGMRFTEGARGICDNNVCCANQVAGLCVESDASPLARCCFFKQNIAAAVLCSNGGAPRVEESVLALTERGSGLVADSRSRPNLTRCLVAYNRHFGCHFRDGSKGAVQESFLFSNAEANACIESKSTPSLDECLIMDGGAMGIIVRDGGYGLVNGCHITGDLQMGIVVELDCSPQFESVVVRDIKPGIGIVDSGNAEYEGCYVVGCATGLETREGTSTFHAVDFRDCSTAVRAAGGKATVDECSFAHMLKGALYVESSGAIVFKNCKLFHCKAAIVSEGDGEIANCELTYNVDGITVVAGDIAITANTVLDCSGTGVAIKGGSPVVTQNFVFDNHNASVQIDGGAPTVEDNRIYFARDGGAIVNNRPEASRVQKNLERNTTSPAWEKTPVDRHREYSQQSKMDIERGTQRYKRSVKILDAVYTACVLAAREAMNKVDVISPPNMTRTLQLGQPFDFDELELQSSAMSSLVLTAVKDAEAAAAGAGTAMLHVEIPAFAASYEPSPPGMAVSTSDASISRTASAVGGSRAELEASQRALGRSALAANAPLSPTANPSANASGAVGSSNAAGIAGSRMLAGADYVPVRSIGFITTAFSGDGAPVMIASPTDDNDSAPGSTAAPSPGRVTFGGALARRRQSSIGPSHPGSPLAATNSAGMLGDASANRPLTAAALAAGDCPVLDAIVVRYANLIHAIGYNPRSETGKGTGMGASGMAQSGVGFKSGRAQSLFAAEKSTVGNPTRKKSMAPTKPEGRADGRRRSTKVKLSG